MQFATTKRTIPMKANSYFVMILFAIIGVALSIGGFYEINNTRSFLANSKKADGVVTDIITSMGSKGGTMFSTQVSFIDEKGKQIIFISGTSSSTPSFHKGDNISVFYDPSLPEYAKIDSFMELWIFPTILIPMGLIFALIGILGIISKFRKKDEVVDPNQDLLQTQPASVEDVLKIIREIKK